MKFYIATRFEDLERAATLARQLRELGHTIVSSWHDTEAIDDEPLTKQERWELAMRDLEEIDNCHTLIALVPEGPVLRGGYHVEVGYAMGVLKAVLLVGPKQNIFHEVLCGYYDTEEELLNAYRTSDR